MKRIKTITSYAGHSRFLAEVKDEPIGYLARCQTQAIPSPYAYSPSNQVLDWNGRRIVIFEVSHKRFEVYEIPANLPLFVSDDRATEYHIRFGDLTALANAPTDQPLNDEEEAALMRERDRETAPRRFGFNESSRESLGDFLPA